MASRIARFRRLAGRVLCLVGLLLAAAISWAEPLHVAEAPRPLAPAESLKLFQLVPGFHVELVAAEPLLADPVGMAFDAQGRIFVCEIHGYNLEGYLDVAALNKSGQLDKAVRRIQAPAEAQREAARQQYSTVKLLEDTDGDGRMDRATVWANHLPPCYGLVPMRDGVIALCPPEIIFLADPDREGKPRVRRTLFSGFGLYELWSRINNPRWGLDNWIYAANGIRSGGTISGPNLKSPVRLPSTSFRFKPDGSAIEPTSGSSSGFGLTLNDWGDRFLVSNQQHALYAVPIADRYLLRNPYCAGPPGTVNISTYGNPARVFPISQPDPWRLERSKDPRWVKFYGAAEATANGFFTSASGQTIYQGDQFPAEFHGNHFSVDNAQNMVHRCLLIRDGLSYRVERPAADAAREFLATTEQWFRPVNLSTGPDGALYIVDMYRAIIEDYSAIPRYLQQIYLKSLIAGADKGRLYRVVADGAVRPERVDLAHLASAELVSQLNAANGWRRQTAQRLLVERADRSVVAALVELAARGATPQARLHALYTLDGLGALDPAVIRRALNDEHFALRMHAVLLAEPWLARRAELLDGVLARTDDTDSRVRLQAALTLGESRDARAVAALGRLAARFGDDLWMQAALLSSALDSADRLLADVLARPQEAGRAVTMVRPLAAVVGARRNAEQLTRLLQAAAAHSTAELCPTCLEGLVEGLRRAGDRRSAPNAPLREVMRQLLTTHDQRARILAAQAAGLLGLADFSELRQLLAEAAAQARDPALALPQRVAAVERVGSVSGKEGRAVLIELLDARYPAEIQVAAVRALATADDAQSVAPFLARWPEFTPQVHAAMLEVFFARQDRLRQLLEAIGEKKVPQSALDATHRGQLREHPDTQVRRLVERYFDAEGTRADRAAVLARYSKALAAPRNAAHGKEVFEKQCAKCHQVQGHGYTVGPDLSVITRKSDEMLLSDVLDPSNQITMGYNNYTVITQQGRIFTGLLAAETATSVTLRREQSAEDVVLRKDIDSITASTGSLMPENIEKEITPFDLADLFAYLREAFRNVPARPN